MHLFLIVVAALLTVKYSGQIFGGLFRAVCGTLSFLIKVLFLWPFQGFVALCQLNYRKGILIMYAAVFAGYVLYLAAK